MNTQNSLIELVRLGLENTSDCNLSSETSWEEVRNLAFLHGVGAIAFDGIQCCYDKDLSIEIDIQTKLEWIGSVHQAEVEYQKQLDTIASLAKFYQKHGIRMMVLKGYGLSLNYPKPNHRPCSDLDIYLFGEQQRADRLVEEELGIKVDNSHHHHTVFVYQGITVENHYDFLNVYSHHSTKKIETYLKKLCYSEYRTIKVGGAEIYLPSTNFDALFVLRHMAVEFAATGMNLRQVIDWGVFIKNYHTVVRWNEFLPMVKVANMHYFLDAINYICYTYLGFDRKIFQGFGDDSYGERVFADLFNPENALPKQKGFIRYIASRLQNWWSNRWRHRIVYSDSLCSTFMYQTYAHLMKPATLHH